MQTVLDSFCRCFGAPEAIPRPDGSGGHDNSNNNTNSNNSINNVNDLHHQYRHQQEDSIVDSSTSRSDVKRRTDRLELQDKQWDELFEKASCTPRSGVVETATASTAAMDNTNPDAMDCNTREDLEYAQALAKVKLAANPSRHRSSHKRKRPAKSRDEIFRHRRFEEAHATTTHYNPKPKTAQPSTPFSRFLSGQGVVANALCFATPIRDTDEEPTTVAVQQESNDNSDANTLNTCEDTITSTLYFDSKYAHVVQSQPPMPLFNQFKVDDRHEDELRRIVASDSHNSLKMIRLMHSGSPPPRDHAHIMKLMADSSDSEGESPQTSPERESTTNSSTKSHLHGRRSDRTSSTTNMDLDDPPPAVKAITNSSRSSSSRSNTAPLTPSSSGQVFHVSEKNSNDRRFMVL